MEGSRDRANGGGEGGIYGSVGVSTDMQVGYEVRESFRTASGAVQ